MTKQDWQTNIENAAASVAAKYGNEVAASVFRHFDAICFENLSPTYYSDVFGDLMFIDEEK